MHGATGRSSDAVRTTWSGLVAPAPTSRAPALPGCEFAQPRPATPKFEHGQGVASEPSPKQAVVIAPVPTVNVNVSHPMPYSRGLFRMFTISRRVIPG